MALEPINTLNIITPSPTAQNPSSGSYLKFTELFWSVLAVVTRGADLPGSKMLKFNNWFEIPLVSIKIDQKVYSGHFRPYVLIGSLTDFQNWHATHRGSFIDYFHKVRLAQLDRQLIEKVKNKNENVHYFSSSEINHFKIIINNHALYTNDSVLSEWKKAMDSDNEIRFSSFLNNRPTQPAELTKVPSGQYMYVLNNMNELVIAPAKNGEIHHSSLSGGEAVLGVGEMWIEDGCITKIDNSSGHYRPKICQLMNVLEFFKHRGINPSSFSISMLIGLKKHPGIKRAERIYTHLKAGEGDSWMEEQKKLLLDQNPSLKLNPEAMSYSYATIVEIIEKGHN